MRTLLFANAIGLSLAAFASYFDVYSHRHFFVGVDPWWNPAHLMLYAGLLIIAYGVARDRPRGALGNLSVIGVALVLAAGAFNEAWHRVLLFGNPLPEPFPVEPPHAVLAAGFIVLGFAALLSPVIDESVVSDVWARIAASFTGGSLWLMVAGSAFYVGGAYQTSWALLFAVGVASFSASLFLAYPTGLTRRFGFSTLAYLWFFLVYYVFFVSLGDGLPLGLIFVLAIDFALSRERIAGINPRLVVLPLVAIAYGLVYYPILDPRLTVALNEGLIASALGVGVEYSLERSLIKSAARLLPSPGA